MGHGHGFGGLARAETLNRDSGESLIQSFLLGSFPNGGIHVDGDLNAAIAKFFDGVFHLKNSFDI